MERIGIVGAGAIGGWVAGSFAAAGHDVSVLARGATLEVLSRHGIALESGRMVRHGVVKAASDPAELGRMDALFIAVKAPALAGLASQLAPMIGPETVIVPMLNGVPWWFMGADQPLVSVDPEGMIGTALPFGQIVGCVVHASAACPAPGRVHLNMVDKLILGEPSSAGSSERVEKLCDLLGSGGIPTIASPQVRSEIWYKLWGNMTMNPISALTLATVDRILDDPLVEGFALSIMAEAKAIGAAIGCPIEQSGEERNAVTRKLGAFKTSMLQDVEAGRALELDAMLAAPREIAGRVGLPTPAMDALFGLARLMGASRGIYTT